MLPDVSAASERDLASFGGTRGGAFHLHAYTTGLGEFPFGWRRAPHPLQLLPPRAPLPEQRGGGSGGAAAAAASKATSSGHGSNSLFGAGGGGALLGPVAVEHGGLWWLFATEASYEVWRWPWFSRHPEPRYRLRLFSSPSLLGGPGWSEVSDTLLDWVLLSSFV